MCVCDKFPLSQTKDSLLVGPQNPKMLTSCTFKSQITKSDWL